MISEQRIEAMKTHLQSKPLLVVAAAAILCFNAFILLVWWVLIPSDVQSNGAQIFLMIVWITVGWAIFNGHGWVRYAMITMTGVFVGEIINAREPMIEFFMAMSFDEKITKFLCVGCIGLLFTPAANKWYATERAARKAAESKNPNEKATTENVG